MFDEYEGVGTPSLEQRIYMADAIVRATFVSEANGLLHFTAVEYLKGSGPSTFAVQATAGKRDTQRDNREAVLLLAGSDGGAADATRDGPTADFEFTDTTDYVHGIGSSGLP